MSNFLSEILNKRLIFTQSWLPKNCLLCQASCKGDLCSPCQNNLPRLPSNLCPSCLLPTINSQICGHCLTHPPAWSHAIAALHYAFPVDAIIRSLKYQENLSLAPVLADLLAAELKAFSSPDFIIPVPLHPAKLRERGFNQAVEIGRYVSKQMGSPLLRLACVRTRDTLSQTELSWKERRGNVQNAFKCNMSLAQKHVALLDDVMTSGATLHELTKAVLQRGASKVSVWVIARAIPSLG